MIISKTDGTDKTDSQEVFSTNSCNMNRIITDFYFVKIFSRSYNMT